jgi:hypothetical protein
MENIGYLTHGVAELDPDRHSGYYGLAAPDIWAIVGASPCVRCSTPTLSGDLCQACLDELREGA